MESIIQQQQNQQYLPSATTTTPKQYSSNSVIFSDAISNNDTKTTTIKTINNTYTTTTTPTISDTTKNFTFAESFHSQNSICSTTKSNENLIEQQKLQPQLQENIDQNDSLTDGSNVFSDYQKEHDNDDDDDVDDDCNQLKNNDINLDNNKGYNSNTISNDEINEKLKKSFSSSNLRSNFRKSHTCGSLFANCNCDSSNSFNLLSTSAGAGAGATAKIIATTTIENLTKTPTASNISQRKSLQNQLDNVQIYEEITTAKSQQKHPIKNNSKSSKHTRACSDSYYVLNNNYNSNNISLIATSKATTTGEATNDHHNTTSKKNRTSSNSCCSSQDYFTTSNDLNNSQRNSDIKIANADGCNFRKTSQTATNNNSKTLENYKKKNRKIFQSYSHPDTNFIFTDENCNPNNKNSKENLHGSNHHHQHHNQSQTQTTSITTKSGFICVKHPKRSSSPNIGNFTTLDIHPEILLKIHKSDPNLKSPSDHRKIFVSRSRTSSASSSTSSTISTSASISSVLANNPKHQRSPQSIEDNIENIVAKKSPNKENQFKVISRGRSVLTKKSDCINNFKEVHLKLTPKRSLPNLPSTHCDTNCKNSSCQIEKYSGGLLTLLNFKKDNNNKCSESPTQSLTNNNTVTTPNTTELKALKLESAHKYFQESGILGPNVKTEKVNKLIRKTSKIIQESNFIEQVRKNSKIILSNNSPNHKNQISKVIDSAVNEIDPSKKTVSPSINNPVKDNMNNSNNDNKGLQIVKNSEVKNEIKTEENFNNSEKLQHQPYVDLNKTSKNIGNNSCESYNNSNNKNELKNIHINNINCNCDSRIQTLVEEIGTLKEIVCRRDNEIHKLKREIHKLKSVLQQTNASRILLNEKNIFQNKHHSGYHHNHHHQQHHHHHQLQIQPKTSLNNTSNEAINVNTNSNNNNNNCKLVNGEYNYVGLVGIPSSGNCNNIEKKLIKAKSHDQDMLKDTIKNVENGGAPGSSSSNNSSCATCISKSSANFQSTATPAATVVVKKQGVSGESSDSANNLSQNIPIPKYEKDFRSKQLIKDAIMDNDFLKNIDSTQVRELVESMFNLDVAKGEFVIREGDVGSHLYVSAEGNFEVIKNDMVLGTMGPGKAFGELAILYNCTRTASIRVLSDGGSVWVLDRRVFQQIMMRTGMQRIEENISFLRSVPLLKNLSSDVLAKIADVLEVEFYPAGTYIIRQGASGDTFFLISQGTVKVTQKLGNLQEEKEIRTLQRGDYFGEQALINVDKRTANIIAMTPGVECLTLDRESFNHLIGDLCELKEKNYGDENRILAMKFNDEKEIKIFGANVKQEFPNLKLSDLEVIATLGIGGFGRVELVKCYNNHQHQNDQNDRNEVATYALKCLKKKHIIDTRQEEHVFSERTIMLTCKSPFICRLYKTFRDSKYIYMLLEACMGGEVWTMLRDRGNFNEEQTQFITGCVLQAFEYLHSKDIIYRDLKPENLMLNERGYIKLVDFGFAKHIGNSKKTWTFCGTPEYVAPEIILNKGHDHAVDYWALGVLIHELLNGTPPFTANDPMKTYNIILKGIDMIDFPKHMSKSAVMLIKKLCRDVPAERLGYSKGGMEDIKKHKWFQGFDWDSLANLTLIPPFLRPVSNPLDTSYFDKFPADTEVPPDETSGWDSDF